MLQRTFKNLKAEEKVNKGYNNIIFNQWKYLLSTFTFSTAIPLSL